MGSSSIECLSFRPCRLSSSSSLSRSRGSENMSPFIVKLVSQQSARNMSIFHGHQRHPQSLHKCTTLSSSNGALCPPTLLSNIPANIIHCYNDSIYHHLWSYSKPLLSQTSQFSFSDMDNLIYFHRFIALSSLLNFISPWSDMSGPHTCQRCADPSLQ